MLAKLGEKLRRAREHLSLTQEELAKAVNLSSEFISLIEIGKRSPSLDSLRRISNYLKQDIAYFLAEEKNIFDLLLAEKNLNKTAKKEIKKFRKYCEDYLKLEELTGRRLYPAPEYRSATPEALAREERQRIGAGDEPIRNIFNLMEINGMRILRQPIVDEAQIAGIFVFYHTEQAAFAMLNSAQSHGQQALTAAHEYCHYLRDRQGGPILDNSDIFIDEYLPLYHPREKFAQKFALHFLVPQEKLKQIMQDEFRTGIMRFEDVIYIKRYFGTSTAIMLKILQQQGYLSRQKNREYKELDHAAYEMSLFGDRVGEGPTEKNKRQSISSDRYKSLGVLALQSSELNDNEIPNP